VTELSDLFKEAVGEAPTFDPAALVARQRHRRQFQLVGAASAFAAVAAIAALLIFLSGGSHDNVAVSTRRPRSDNSSTTAAASTTFANPSTTTDIGSTTTASAPGQTSVPSTGSTTTLPAPTEPQAGDFTGTLTVSPTTLHQGGISATVELSIRNSSDHAIWASLGGQNDVAIYCSTLNSDGTPQEAVAIDTNTWYMTNILMQPGDTDGRTAAYEPPAGYTGSVRCEAVIVGIPQYWREMSVLGVITSIPSVTLTVLPGEATTTVPTT